MFGSPSVKEPTPSSARQVGHLRPRPHRRQPSAGSQAGARTTPPRSARRRSRTTHRSGDLGRGGYGVLVLQAVPGVRPRAATAAPAGRHADSSLPHRCNNRPTFEPSTCNRTGPGSAPGTSCRSTSKWMAHSTQARPVGGALLVERRHPLGSRAKAVARQALSSISGRRQVDVEPRRSARLALRTPTGELAAIVVASSSAASRSVPADDPPVHQPEPRHLVGIDQAPGEDQVGRARDPTRRESNWVPPPPG